MTTEIILVFSILFITIILFAFEVFSVDKIAMLIIASLALTGLVKPEEAISGFSNTATITVLSLMIIALALEDNGVIASLARFLKNLHILPLFLLLPIFMFITGGISAFINTTAVVIVFIKIISELAKRFNVSQSKLLLPISFAGILGGSCTLMGTSTNLIVNSVARDLGAERFSFFEFSFFGVIFLIVGIIVVTIASRWLPNDSKEDLQDAYDLDNYVTTVVINKGSNLIDKNIEDTFLYNNPEISILKLTRNKQITNAPGRYITLKANDKLLLMCDLENLTKINEAEGLSVHKTQENDKKKIAEKFEEENGNAKKQDDLGFVELLILPGSILIGKTLKQLRKQTFQSALPIAIKKRRNIRNTKERLVRKNIEQITLKPGDRLLVEIPKNEIGQLYEMENVAILREHKTKPVVNTRKKTLSFVILLLVIGLAASGILSILISAITGVSLLLLTRCLDLNDVYHRINWQVIFLLAGMMPLGIAMNNTGADKWISDHLLVILSGQSNLVVIGLIFLITMLMSSVVSNNATAIIMTPIAIAVAVGLDLSMKPFILSVLFGANFSFFTPMGYQTNTLIYGMGIYKFKHFFIIGGILSIILWVLGTFMLSTLF
ncbi:sodium:proton antiporter [Aequorivita antarctica]|uniref:TRAP transporter large permease subunit n=1 Tax=Aequorivita antarctica TaxID=153266 RepID=A0A5C6Z438_9FLAO|nr:sodium:proton antiporter [Aequorivita antarctica]TXD74296.1 TRAP transporter large permease subunit [Aequorivita antarctica]SRX73641.1 L-tartrate/succinate antiporter [Aequorivita antarctica]